MFSAFILAFAASLAKFGKLIENCLSTFVRQTD
jgi:hypothetical protein